MSGQGHGTAKTAAIVLVLGMVVLLGIYSLELLSPAASIILSAIVLVAAFFFVRGIWKAYK